MSITLQRSKREVQFEMSKLPAKIGPGTYNPERNPQDLKECVAPFNSILEREKAYKTNENPGPGTYTAEQVKFVPTTNDKIQNAFKTKISRFCPTAPGSSIFNNPTYVENPGPGTHFQSLKFQGNPKSTDAKRALYNSKTHGELVVVPKAVPAGIPGRKIAQNAYTGLGQDTVGPALYNPNHDTQKTVAQQNNFTSSKVTRKLFEPENKRENTIPSKDIPGPGKYFPVDQVNNKQFNATGLNSYFSSKVPNCKEQKIKNQTLPGPGTYDQKLISNGDPNGIGSKFAEKSTDESSNFTQTQNPFLSGTNRGDMWKNEFNAPFTKASFIKNPGPGQYFTSKKKDDIKQRLLQEEIVTVPFGACEDRPCNKPIKANNPGPGTYIDINNPNTSSVCKSLAKIQEEQQLAASQGVKIGAFGSTTERQTFWAAPKNGPAPGQYDVNMDLADATTDLALIGKTQKARVNTCSDIEHRKPNSIFASTANRFDLVYSNKNPEVRLLTQKGAPRKKYVTQLMDNKTVMRDQADIGIENQITCLGYSANGESDWHKQTRAGDFEQQVGKKVGFDSTSPRFHFNQAHYGQSLKFDVPGPGQYKDSQGRPKTFNQPRNKTIKYSVVFDTSERRFKTKGITSFYHQGSTQAQIGPGSYLNLENSMIKKSYNMSVEHSYFV